jgi:hypothetical protein
VVAIASVARRFMVAFPSGLFFKLLDAGANGLSTCRHTGADGTCDRGKIDFQIEIVPADGTGTAKGSKRRLLYVAVFEQLSGKTLLTLIQICGVPGSKHNGPSKN